MEVGNPIADEADRRKEESVFSLSSPLVLVGLMGAGKSTIGRRLARELGVEFVDSDEEIEVAAGCSVSDIFEIYGEPKFRDLEKRVIQRLLGGEPLVIATGGGAFIDKELREAILARATVLWLRAELDVLLERVGRRNSRPLLQQGDKRATLSRLMEERHPAYAQAHITIDSGEGTHETVVHDIVACLKNGGKERI